MAEEFEDQIENITENVYADEYVEDLQDQLEDSIINDTTQPTTLNEDNCLTGNFMIDWFRKRTILDEFNVLCAVWGARGKGKSTCAISLALKIDPTFNLTTLSQRVVTSAEEFAAVINTSLPRGACIVWDDAQAGGGISSRESLTASNKAISNILSTFRDKHLIVFFTTPVYTFLDCSVRAMFDAVIKVERKDSINKVTIARFFTINGVNPKTGEPYLHKLRDDCGKRLQPMHIKIPPLKIRNAYMKIRNKFTTRVNVESQGKLIKVREKAEKPKDDGKIKCPNCNSSRVYETFGGRAIKAGTKCKCFNCRSSYTKYPPTMESKYEGELK